MNSFRLDGKVALITGGGSGIGRGIAQKFAENGAVVHILDINAEGARQTVGHINDQGGLAYGHHCDVTQQHQVVKTMDAIRQSMPIDILVCNAGIGYVGNIRQTSEATLDKLYAVNVKGVYNCMYACIPHLVDDGGGVMLNIASTLSSLAIADRFGYSMTKGAVLTMTYSVAVDYLEAGVRCNCISPARIHTPFVDHFLKKNYPDRQKEMFEKLSKAQPLGRMGMPEEVANTALFLCSDEAAFITGCDYAIDGGFIKLRP